MDINGTPYADLVKFAEDILGTALNDDLPNKNAWSAYDLETRKSAYGIAAFGCDDTVIDQWVIPIWECRENFTRSADILAKWLGFLPHRGTKTYIVAEIDEHENGGAYYIVVRVGKPLKKRTSWRGNGRYQ